MAKKTKSAKRFLDVLKFYLSSMTSRSCKYLYFNCLDDPKTLIFTNGDYDLLTQEGYNLSIHILKVKSDNFFDELKEVFGFTSTEPYVVHLKKCLDIINKCLKSGDELKSYVDVEGQLLLTNQSDERSVDELTKDLAEEAKAKFNEDLKKGVFRESSGDDEDDDDSDDEDIEIDMSNIILPLLEYSHAFGTKMSDFRNFVTLKEQSEYILAQWKQLSNRPYIEITPNEAVPFRSSVFKISLNLDLFKNLDGTNALTDTNKDSYTYLLQDGLDSPSLKEFVKKLTPDWSSKMFSFVDTSGKICLISMFINEDMEILSVRPYAGIIPAKVIKTEKSEAN